MMTMAVREGKQKVRPTYSGPSAPLDGGDKGSRTPDLLNAIETLYQLSYIPKKENAHMLSKHGTERKCFFKKYGLPIYDILFAMKTRLSNVISKASARRQTL